MERKNNSPFPIILSLPNSNRKTNTPSRSISQVFAENTIKEKNLDYQQLLIRTKELEIQMGELRAQLDKLKRIRQKADRLADEASQRKERALVELKGKQCYLQKYHQQLDRQFRGGKEDLFAGLKKLEQNLLEMYQRDQRRIRESLNSQRQELGKLSEMVGTQRLQRDLLLQELRSHEGVKEEANIGNQQSERDQISAENVFLKGEIERLQQQKKSLQVEERNLKRILNVQQEHKKHGAIIAAGIRKMFSIRVKEQRYKQAVSQDYAKNLMGLKEIISKRLAEKKALASQLMQKNSILSKIKQQNSLRNKEYSQLEDQLFNMERK